MNLTAYLLSLTTQQKREFYERCELSHGHIQDLKQGRRKAGPKAIMAIFEATVGEVRGEDLRPELYPSKQGKAA